MPIENLINFIERQLIEGVDKAAIQQALLKSGYSSIEIEQALKAVSEAQSLVTGIAPEQETSYISTQAPKTFPKKKLLKFIAIGALVLIAGISFYFYGKIAKVDPISLLPQETGFYLRIKINPEDRQIKNLKGLLAKFPNYDLVFQTLNQEFEELKKENPPFKNFDFSIADEIIYAYTVPLEETMTEQGFVAILSNPDLVKILELAKDIEASINENENWKIEKQTYKGRIIFKIVPVGEPDYEALPEALRIELAAVFTNGHIVLAPDIDNLKKIIDIADSQKITSAFAKDKIANINTNPLHSKFNKYFSKDYLALFYSQFNWSDIFQIAQNAEMLADTIPGLDSSFINALKAGLNLPFLNKQQAEDFTKIGVAGIISAGEQEITSEAYYFDLGEDPLLLPEFSMQDSLSQFIPLEIQGREIFFYREERDLKSMIEQSQKISNLIYGAQDFEDIEDFSSSLKELIGIDLEQDILPLLTKNYAVFLSTQPTGEEIPRLGFIFEVDNENKVKENLLKISIPKSLLGFEQSGTSAKDAMIISNMQQLRVVAEIDYSYGYGYTNFSCSGIEARLICDDIKEQASNKPITYASKNDYCGYVKLNEPEAYYCINSEGQAIKTYINPGITGYCNGSTFACPGEGIPPPLLPEDMINFSKEIVNGFEIYSLPVYEEFGLNFAIENNKLVFTLTKQGLVEILNAMLDTSQAKLKDSSEFNDLFKQAPKNIGSIVYAEPYGLIGLIKYGVYLYTGYFLNSMSEYGMAPEETMISEETIISPIFEFLDKAIAPYLQILKTTGTYAFSPEKGLIITKAKLIIEELPLAAKQECEQFWANIDHWAEENLEPLMLWFMPYPMF